MAYSYCLGYPARMLRKSVTAAAVALALACAGADGFPVAPAAAQGCVSDAAARQAFQSGQARPLSAFLGAIAAATGGGRPVSAQLCGGAGNYVWQVVVLTGNGQQTRLTVDARSGAIY
jgi:uncharacterized membrane protein YkoI